VITPEPSESFQRRSSETADGAAERVQLETVVLDKGSDVRTRATFRRLRIAAIAVRQASSAGRFAAPICDLKHNFGLAFLRVRRIERVRLHADLVMLGRLSLALSRARVTVAAASPS